MFNILNRWVSSVFMELLMRLESRTDNKTPFASFAHVTFLMTTFVLCQFALGWSKVRALIALEFVFMLFLDVLVEEKPALERNFTSWALKWFHVAHVTQHWRVRREHFSTLFARKMSFPNTLLCLICLQLFVRSRQNQFKFHCWLLLDIVNDYVHNTRAHILHVPKLFSNFSRSNCWSDSDKLKAKSFLHDSEQVLLYFKGSVNCYGNCLSINQPSNFSLIECDTKLITSRLSTVRFFCFLICHHCPLSLIHSTVLEPSEHSNRLLFSQICYKLEHASPTRLFSLVFYSDKILS